ncbi:uncharacterized protein LDX57_003193 [Aspergillus melleus]|uniref:uncharacterized protein n=1 Tax=Aspergillus melleus TaxID=138277 RepID=UPI001E8CDE31|nr:uncharacterized protein LDX57_003193 [Aspergillus melleus]KAH8425440.1 hypothetical protein LDX57_003193 [Aspergillus melleus]
MKYKSPKVEEYPETDESTAAFKRKRNDRDLEYLSTTKRQAAESKDQAGEEDQPPAKAAKQAPAAAPTAEEDDFDEEDETGEFDENDADAVGDEEEEEEVDEVDQDEDVEPDEQENDEERDEEGEEEGEGEEEEEATDKQHPKVQKAIDQLGRTPLDGTSIAKEPLTASAETVLAMVIDAMLKSRPISHDLSQRAINKLIEVGYHDIHKLGESSWEERTAVLRDGGYNRYREQGATNLGDLAHFVDERYDGDLNNLWEEAHHDRAKTRELIKEIKGLGDLGVELFFNNVQSVWPSIAPFVDTRSLKTADQVGLGTDLDAIYTELEKDSVKMSRLANGLSVARLEKRQGELLV